ncbi:MAG TPA: histidine kinase [Thermoanaerobaculia bacterium]|nr:histidine kinase [Thermoanaerobaculia bacterium]
MNCSQTQRTSRIAILCALMFVLGCAKGRDQATRFGGGAEQSVNDYEVHAGRSVFNASPYVTRMPLNTFTLRRTVILRGSTERTRCVYVSLIGSFELLWDGQRIGATGKPGPMDNFFPIPAALAGAGRHSLELRVALPRIDVSWYQGVVIGDYERMIRSRIVGQVIPLSGFGVFVVIGIYYLTLSLATRRRSAAITFAFLCFAAALLAVAETWRWTVGYTYDVQATRLTIVTALTFAISLLLPCFFVLELELRRTRMWIAAFIALISAVALIPLAPDDRCLALFGTALFLSACTLAAAIRARGRRTIPGAAAVSILVLAFVRGGFGFSDNMFFIAFCAAIASLLIGMALETRRQRREHERLEAALLHKMIEPHFVMNTLTALMEWVESDPANGVRFLEAFAEELRIFSSIARDTRIPIEREIALCRSHLAVMECRKGKRFHLRAESVDPDGAIPPAVLHTLVENALTHNRYDGDEIEFQLREERSRKTRRYIFDAPVAAASNAANPHGDGTGLRYVKARLEESYPGRWFLQTGEHEGCWRTTIEVPA